jgi:uncharacterized membrane protein YfcA
VLKSFLNQNHRVYSYYSIACLLAGVVGALAGVGGSTIKQPLMLQFGFVGTSLRLSFLGMK